MHLDPVASAREIPDGSAYERAILDGLQTRVGFDAAFFATLGETPTTVALDPRTLERAFASHVYDQELWPIKRAAIEARGVAVDTSVLGESAVRQRAYHRDLAAPVGGRHSLLAYMILRGRPIGALMLGRSGASFSDHDVAMIESLLPQITVARASYRVPWVGGPLRRAPAATVLDRLRGGRVLARVDGADGTVVVRDKDGYREMVAMREDAELVWSRAALGDPRRSGWFYVDLFHLAAARARQRKRALFVGCGGGVGIRQFAEVYPGIAIDLVDSDPAVVQLARDWYDLGAIPQLTVHVADGFDLIREAKPETWDVIVVDAYDASDHPDAMSTRPFFRAIRRVLRRGGGMAFNAIGSLSGTNGIRRVELAARSELLDVRLVPVLDPDEAYSPTAVRNIIVLAGA